MEMELLKLLKEYNEFSKESGYRDFNLKEFYYWLSLRQSRRQYEEKENNL